MSKKLVRNAMKTRHPSLEMTDPECVAKKKPDVLTKARNKFWNLSDVLKHSKNHPENDKKQKPHSTLEYFLRSHHKDKIFSNSSSEDRRAGCLQKQNSLGTYPIRIEITDDDEERISRTRPATVCLARVLREDRDTDALALERPRKKLSFREPEISTNSDHNKTFPYKIKRSCSDGNDLTRRSPSFEDVELESQAMRVVRTIGQAFEVCHKLSITAPEQEHVDQDEQETLTQDLISESLSDSCDKQKRDISDCASDRASFTQEDNPKTAAENRKNLRSLQLDILPPPSSQDKKSPLTSAETYSSPHSDVLMSTGSGSGGSASLPPPGSALSSHHELQLLREQLEQQSQQTQAAMAQLQLAREQLAAEQSARMEAQARTHQLLVHNRELLDHIAALVAHLQDGEKASGQHQQSSPHVAMPQRQDADNGYSRPDSLDHSAILQALGLTPTSPLRNYNNPVGTGGGVFNYNFQEPPLDAQLLQRLQALVGYTPPQYQYPYPFMGYYNPAAVLNNNYTLQPPPQKKIPTSPLPMRNSYQGSPGGERRVSPMAEQNYHQQNCSTPQPLRKEQPQQQQRAASEDPFIKPLPQMGTLTTTDTDGHVRMIVPVPSNPADNTSNLMASLRLSDDFGRYSGPGNITRSSSERVPHRSEMMSQVQRTAWARHTTK